jgi:hypothetical protein
MNLTFYEGKIMSRTTFSGPVKSGTNRYSPTKNVGTTVLTQATEFAFTAAGTTTNTFYIPAASKILSITFDTTTAFTGGTGAVTVGNVAAGTQYASSTTVTSGGRATPTFTAAQLTSMLSTPIDVAAANSQQASSSIAVTAVAGAGVTAGSLVVTITYIQSDDRSSYNTQ